MLLFKKLYRTLFRYKSQFISMVLMIALGIGVFAGMNGEWMSLKKDSDDFYDETQYADYWLYSKTPEGFSEEDRNSVEKLDGVDSAVRRLEIDTVLKDKDKTISLNVYDRYDISKNYVVEGKDYSTESTGIWINDKFAELNNISVGDEITLVYNTYSITEKVEGLIKNPEYLYAVENETQIMPEYDNYGYAFISPKEFKAAAGVEIYNQILIKSDLEKDEIEKAVDKALPVSTLLLGREEQPSYAMMLSEIQEGQTMGDLLPVVFLLIAILTMITTMRRITVNEKVQIGTLKALGFRDRRIIRHYSFYGLFIGVIGAVIGIIFGFGISGMIVSPDRMEGTCFDMPYWKLYMPGWVYAVTVIIVLVLMLISYLSTKNMLKGTAADALRSYSPKKVRRMLIEKTRLWNRLSFGTIWNLRDIFRSKVRTLMSLFGVVGCVVLLVAAIGMKDTMDAFLNLMYEDVCNYKYSISIAENSDKESVDKLIEDADGDTVSSVSINIDGDAHELDIYDISHDLYHFLNTDNDKVELGDDGAYVCMRIADKYNLKEGDVLKFKIYGQSKEYEIKIAGIVRSLMTENISMTEKYAESLGIQSSVKFVYSDSEINASDYDCVSKVETLQDTIDTFDTFMEIMYEMIIIIGVAAIVLGVVVLYNLGVMSYTERYRELATLKVVGFEDKTIGRLLIKQNIWITIAGIIIGIPCGYLLLKNVMTELATEYELSIYISAATYIFTFVLTFGVSLLVSLLISGKNKKIDMVEAMKGIE